MPNYLLMGVNGAFPTGDIFNLFVFFEILLNASYALTVLGSEPGQLRETLKYLFVNMIASTFFLIGLAMLYRTMGTLNMADLAFKVQMLPNSDGTLLTVPAMAFLFGFGTKAAIFQTFILIFCHNPGVTHELLLIIAASTMVLRVFGAISQMDIKRILSCHIVCQIGYMILGIGLFTTQALAGALFYIIHHVIVKSTLFLVSGVVQMTTGTTHLKKIGGLQARSWILNALFLIAALSLAGIPPLSGFFSKFIILKEGVQLGRYGYVAIGLVCSLLTIFSMLKIGNGVFWGEHTGEIRQVSMPMLLPGVILLVALTVSIGLFPHVIYGVVEIAAEQMISPDAYIEAVLGSESVTHVAKL